MKLHRCLRDQSRTGVGPAAVEGIEIPASGRSERCSTRWTTPRWPVTWLTRCDWSSRHFRAASGAYRAASGAYWRSWRSRSPVSARARGWACCWSGCRQRPPACAAPASRRGDAVDAVARARRTPDRAGQHAMGRGGERPVSAQLPPLPDRAVLAQLCREAAATERVEAAVQGRPGIRSRPGAAQLRPALGEVDMIPRSPYRSCTTSAGSRAGT